MKIGKINIGRGCKPFIIAEVAQSHDGSLGQAMAFIDIAASCGADAIKFQTHIASEESTPAEPWRIKFSHQDQSRYEYWQRMSFPQEWWSLLKDHAEDKGLVFLSSPFSVKAVGWLEDIGMDAWKIASGEVYNEELIDRIEKSGKPIIISSGLSDLSKSKALAERFLAKNIDVSVLHCTTMYPTPPEEVGLNVLEVMQKDLPNRVVVGLSDHSGTVVPSIVSAYLGAAIFEVHLTMHKKMFGPDVPASLDPNEFSELVRGVHFAVKMQQSEVQKPDQLSQLSDIKSIFGRSLVFNRDLECGHILEEEDIGYKKPGTGMAYDKRSLFLGKKLLKSVSRDAMLGPQDVKGIVK
ncbi:N-acetylneuraminate synthase family protein [Pseudomonadales bacterium]|nr:N-acetylneuraminate synthase family protein [Pseudomonadales bacterium]